MTQKDDAIKTQQDSKEQEEKDFARLRFYIFERVLLARTAVEACKKGDDSIAFRETAVLLLIDALELLRSRQIVSGILFSLIAQAISAIAVDNFEEADEILGRAISML